MRSRADKPIVWLRGEVKTPPFGAKARIDAGVLLRQIQRGELPGMPHVRPMPSLGLRCFELRVHDDGKAWRLLIRIDSDAIVVADVFQKTTRVTPARVITEARRRLRAYNTEANG